MTVAEAPAALAQSAVLNAESVISVVPYAVYRAAYLVNEYSNIPVVNRGMSGLQRAGLWGDKVIDRLQESTGYPAATVRDEAQPVHIFPSIIYPSSNGNGWWQWTQNKWSFGPVTSGPGVHPNGSEDYIDY